MNVEWRQMAADPQTKPNDLGCESACWVANYIPRWFIHPQMVTHLGTNRV